MLKMKKQSKQWIFPGELVPKKGEMSTWTGKNMMTFFGISFTNYLEKERTITGEYSSDLLVQFDSSLIEEKSAFSS